MASLDPIKMGSEDEQIGVNIVRKALEVPMRKIVENAGKEGSVVVEGVRQEQKKQKDIKIGYDVLREEYINMVKGGVIDPPKSRAGRWRTLRDCCDDPDH